MGGKLCQNIKPPTPKYISSSVYTTKHLGKIRRLGYKQFLHFLLYVNSLKKIFVSKQNLTVLKNVHFLILTAPKNIKAQKIKFNVVFSYKDCI